MNSFYLFLKRELKGGAPYLKEALMNYHSLMGKLKARVDPKRYLKVFSIVLGPFQRPNHTDIEL